LFPKELKFCSMVLINSIFCSMVLVH
jgi:hypothetical protein